MSNLTAQDNYASLKKQISALLAEGRRQAARSVNTILVQTYWRIGQYIVDFEQGGSNRAVYGTALIDRLARDLTLEYGKGFSRSNLFQIRQFYLSFPKVQTLSEQLSWSHYCELLKADDELEREFYLKQCEQENWSVRELRRQMKSALFQRLALSRDKEGVLSLARDGNTIEQPEDLIRDPYVFEFLGIPEQRRYLAGRRA